MLASATAPKPTSLILCSATRGVIRSKTSFFMLATKSLVNCTKGGKLDLLPTSFPDPVLLPTAWLSFRMDRFLVHMSRLIGKLVARICSDGSHIWILILQYRSFRSLE